MTALANSMCLSYPEWAADSPRTECQETTSCSLGLVLRQKTAAERIELMVSFMDEPQVEDRDETAALVRALRATPSDIKGSILPQRR